MYVINLILSAYSLAFILFMTALVGTAEDSHMNAKDKTLGLCLLAPIIYTLLVGILTY